MVAIKIAAILIFVIGAAHAVNTANWHPFLPNGIPGMLTGSAIVFFTYIGFDSVSTAAEECRNPQRDMPVGIIATLIVCAVLYIAVALVLTGIAHWTTLNTDAPVADALKHLGMNKIRGWVTVGALVGMISSLLVFQYGQARIWFAMSRDGLLPKLFSRSPPEIRDAARQHVDRGPCGRDSGRHLGYRYVRRSFEYRDAVRVYRGFGGRDRAAENAAGAAAQFPRALVSGDADSFDRVLPGADAGPAAEPGCGSSSGWRSAW